MSVLSNFSDVLHTYDVQAIRLVPQDYGPPTVEPITAVIPISGQKQGTKEAIAAGLVAGTELYRMYSGPGLDERITEKQTLRVWRDGVLVGDMNLRSRVDYRGEHVELEATMLNTA